MNQIVKGVREFLHRFVRPGTRRAAMPLNGWLSFLRRPDIAIFHDFVAPPYGGGNQFLLALGGEFELRGYTVEGNHISPSTRACLYNSFNFDFDRLRQLKRSDRLMVHRVGGPIGAYRGWDDGTDGRILEINHELADVTIFQSRYSKDKHLELGMEFQSPVVIPDAADPQIFHPNGRRPFDRTGKTRLISSSWSDNLNKGGPFYAKLETLLDWDRFEYTFVGRTQATFDRMETIAPVPSHDLARILRSHDIYITASQNDPCSNSVIEALQCGLPCLYLDSGGHSELVGEAGFAFSSEEEALSSLNRLVHEYEERQLRISSPSPGDVAMRYLTAMGIEGRS